MREAKLWGGSEKWKIFPNHNIIFFPSLPIHILPNRKTFSTQETIDDDGKKKISLKAFMRFFKFFMFLMSKRLSRSNETMTTLTSLERESSIKSQVDYYSNFDVRRSEFLSHMTTLTTSNDRWGGKINFRRSMLSLLPYRIVKFLSCCEKILPWWGRKLIWDLNNVK